MNVSRSSKVQFGLLAPSLRTQAEKLQPQYDAVQGAKALADTINHAKNTMDLSHWETTGLTYVEDLQDRFRALSPAAAADVALHIENLRDFNLNQDRFPALYHTVKARLNAQA